MGGRRRGCGQPIDEQAHVVLDVRLRHEAAISEKWIFAVPHGESNSMRPRYYDDRHAGMQTAEGLICHGAVQGEPVIPSPTERAAERAQCKHAKQLIDRAQFSLLKLQRVASGTFPPYPQQSGQPSRAQPV